jgi:hypothetical protein
VSPDSPLALRLTFLARVVAKESQHLQLTDSGIFCVSMTPERLASLVNDPELAEKLDAFVARFGRLQDTLGDKLIPALLQALAEQPGAAIDNFDKAEKFGWIESVDGWLEMRRLCNQMVHEYIEDLAVLASALRGGHEFVPSLVFTAQKCVAKVEKVLKHEGL